MNKENVRKWVAALRSGEYKQTTGQLYSDGRYCCLGVVCELAGIKRNGYLYDGSDNFLPKSAMEWLGVEQENPDIGPWRASFWNDKDGATFPEIAALIEKYWLDSESVAQAK